MLNMRSMNKSDIKHLLKMEKGFDKWEDTDFLDCWKKGLNKMVGIVDDKIIGYIVYNFCSDHIELIKISTLKEYDSYREDLINFLKDRLTQKRKKIISYVNERDKKFIYCLRHNNFFAITPILKEFYGDDDCYLMEYLK